MGVLLMVTAAWCGALVWYCRELARPEPAANAVTQAPPFNTDRFQVGEIVDSWRGVSVRHNGAPYWRSVGSHHSSTGYYYGKQWQCVEFIKRFYYDAFGHRMTDVMGHAESFFNEKLEHGAWNAKRDMWQFYNGQDEPPRPDDLMVWRLGNYGHVAVVTRVEPGAVTVVQQNVTSGSRSRLPYLTHNGKHEVGHLSWRPTGWLRLDLASLKKMDGEGAIAFPE